MSLHALRWKVLGTPGSVSARRRALRWRWLLETFPDLAEMSVIDLGGSVTTWERAPVRARHVHVVNVGRPPAGVPPWAEFTRGDACALPSQVAARRYDLVFTNSVIEHVGGHERRLRFAESVHALADSHWVQTPYRYFPIEPHWLFPGLQFLPVAARVRAAQHWPLARRPGRERSRVCRQVLWTELLDRTQMRHYFPQSRLLVERFAGLPKSLIAVRRPGA